MCGISGRHWVVKRTFDVSLVLDVRWSLVVTPDVHRQLLQAWPQAGRSVPNRTQLAWLEPLQQRQGQYRRKNPCMCSACIAPSAASHAVSRDLHGVGAAALNGNAF